MQVIFFHREAKFTIKDYSGRLQQEAMNLKAAVGAPEQQEGYDAEVWVPKIIDYWNNNNKNNGSSSSNNSGDKIFKAWVFQSTGWYT